MILVHNSVVFRNVSCFIICVTRPQNNYLKGVFFAERLLYLDDYLICWFKFLGCRLRIMLYIMANVLNGKIWVRTF